jgi:hypothetical protein
VLTEGHELGEMVSIVLHQANLLHVMKVGFVVEVSIYALEFVHEYVHHLIEVEGNNRVPHSLNEALLALVTHPHTEEDVARAGWLVRR